MKSLISIVVCFFTVTVLVKSPTQVPSIEVEEYAPKSIEVDKELHKEEQQIKKLHNKLDSINSKLITIKIKKLKNNPL